MEEFANQSVGHQILLHQLAVHLVVVQKKNSQWRFQSRLWWRSGFWTTTPLGGVWCAFISCDRHSYSFTLLLLASIKRDRWPRWTSSSLTPSHWRAPRRSVGKSSPLDCGLEPLTVPAPLWSAPAHLTSLRAQSIVTQLIRTVRWRSFKNLIGLVFFTSIFPKMIERKVGFVAYYS